MGGGDLGVLSSHAAFEGHPRFPGDTHLKSYSMCILGRWQASWHDVENGGGRFSGRRISPDDANHLSVWSVNWARKELGINYWSFYCPFTDVHGKNSIVFWGWVFESEILRVEQILRSAELKNPVLKSLVTVCMCVWVFACLCGCSCVCVCVFRFLCVFVFARVSICVRQWVCTLVC